jgi:transcription termination/antitermination protein NusG
MRNSSYNAHIELGVLSMNADNLIFHKFLSQLRQNPYFRHLELADGSRASFDRRHNLLKESLCTGVQATLVSQSTAHNDQALPAWFAIHVRATAERYLADHLTRKGFECFLPTRSTNPRSAGGPSESAPPLFPGYLFCRFHAARKLPLLLTPGVLGVVGVGQIPAPAQEEDIFSLQEAIRRQLLLKLLPFRPSGNPVKVEGGPMTGLTGVLVGCKQAPCLLIDVRVLQCCVEARDWR